MKPPVFEYHRPETVAEAVAMLGALDNARLLAGGQSLMPMPALRFAFPDHLIDINRIPGLVGVEEEGGAVRVGAMTRQRDLLEHPLVRARLPMLAEALAQMGHRQTRNRGTAGGSLCHLDPAAELVTVATALDTTLEIVGPRGERRLAMAGSAVRRSRWAAWGRCRCGWMRPRRCWRAGRAALKVLRRRRRAARRWTRWRTRRCRGGIAVAWPRRWCGGRLPWPGSVPMSAESVRAISMRVNGQDRAVTVAVRRTLGDVLRHDLGLTGTHLGCEHGACGACTVLLDGRAVRACLLLAVRAKVLEVAGALLEVAAGDLEIVGGMVQVVGVPGGGVSLGQVARAAAGQAGFVLPGSSGPALAASEEVVIDAMAYANGSCVAEVEVDTETCAVRIVHLAFAHDCGRALHPRIVEGQLMGGIAHGIGNALFEFMAFDENAQPLTMTVAEYLLVTATEMPKVTIVHHESPSPLNALGIKGVGEAGVIPVGAAVASAVEDALSAFGVSTDRLPLSPVDVLALLERSPGLARQDRVRP